MRYGQNDLGLALGRKVFLFYGSDDHATAAGNVLSLAASCKLHDLDPERYFTEIIRVLPYWPRHRYLELAPKHRHATRARLDSKELERELGPITVPTPAPKAQPSSN
jgi:transposase